MTMFLMNGIRAEVEPVPGKNGWFQLTGRKIQRWTVDVSDTFSDMELSAVEVNHDAKIFGIHSQDSEIAVRDPRFNHENDPKGGGATFGVFEEGGTLWMLIAVNQPEYAIFRFLCPHESGYDDALGYDLLSDYRVEKKLAKPASKVTQVKKKTRAKA